MAPVRPRQTNATPPSEAEVRDALARVAGSEGFRGAAQINRFLTYIVEETLAGRGDRIKAYSVATDALGRPATFDPQSDTIVRVEANRLRRALSDYYAGGGRDDPTHIRLVPGGYQPRFVRASDDVEPPAGPTPSVVARPARPARPTVATATGIVAALLVLAVGARVVYDRTNHHASPIPIPTIYVERFLQEGSAPAAVASNLRDSLQNALARFDEVRVVAGDADNVRLSPLINYRVTATIDNTKAGTPVIEFRLADETDQSVVWTKRFDSLPNPFDAAAQNAVVGEVSTGLADIYSVIGARERAKATFGNLDPRYQCLLDTVAYFRSYNADEHRRVRACLESVTADNPTSVRPFYLLSRVYLREYYFAGPSPEDERRLLDLSYRAAKTAVDNKPQSARAYEALMDSHFVRRELDEALAAGREAIKLNSYDTVILSDYGARLVATGRIKEGLARIREATALRDVRPSWLDFFFAVGAIMDGDTDTATRLATQVMPESYPLTLVCRIVLAVKAGNLDAARLDMARLDVSFPSFRKQPRRELDKIFPATEIVDRLMAGISPVLAVTAENQP